MKVKVGQQLYFANLDISNPQLVQVEVTAIQTDNTATVVPTKVLIGAREDFGGSFNVYDGDNWTRLFKDPGKAKQALIKMAIKEEKALAGIKASDLKSVNRDHKFNVRGIKNDYAGAVKAVRKLLSKLQD